MIDDDSLAAYDLSAWQAPPPPQGIADAVIRQLAKPPLAPVVAPRRRGAWVIAACAVTAAAAAMIVLLVIERGARSEVDTARLESQRQIDRVLAELDQQISALQRDHAATAPIQATPRTIPPVPSTKPPAPTQSQLDRQAVQAGMGRIKGALQACRTGAFAGTVKLTIRVAATGVVEQVDLDRKLPFGRCLQRAVKRTKFAVRSGLMFSYPIVFASPRPVGPCDADVLEQKGKDAYGMGDHALALVLFEATLHCKFSQHVVPMAVLAACSSGNAAKARELWPKLTAWQHGVLQRCISNKIDPRP